MTTSCIFCRIVNGEVPAEVLAREPEVIAFLDVQPLAAGPRGISLTLRTPEGYPHREVVSQTLDAFRDDSRPSRGRWPPRAGLHSGRRRGRPNVLSLYNIGRGRLSMGSVLEYRCPA